MKIKDKMTKNIITANINSNLKEIARLMKEYDIGVIPITEENKIIGLLTDRDIVINEIYNSDKKISDYLSKNIIVVSENEDLFKALEIMKKYKIKRLIVTNKEKVTGIISLSNLLNDIDSKTILEALKEIYAIDKNNHDFNSDIDSFYKKNPQKGF